MSEPVQLVKGNEAGEVDEADLSTALQQGWEVATPEEQAAAKLRGEESGLAGSVLGGVEALGRGATLGLSDLAATELLGADPERMRARQQELGGTADALELVGAAAPALAAGPGGAMAKLASVAPAGGAARLGLAAGRAVGGGKLRRMAAEGAVEGFLQGVGAEVSEAALGDTDLAAERLFSAGVKGLGLGALLGTGAGAAGMGLARVARGGERVSRAALERVAGLGDDLGDPGVKAAMGQGGTLVERAQQTYLRSVGATENAQLGLAHLHKLARSKDGGALIELAKSRSSYADAVGDRVAKVWKGADASPVVERFRAAARAEAGSRSRTALRHQVGQFENVLGALERRGTTAPQKKLAREIRSVLFRESKGADVWEVADQVADPHRWLTQSLDDLDGVLQRHAGTVGSSGLATELAGLRQLELDGLMWGPRAQHGRVVDAATRREAEALKALPAKLRKTIEAGGLDARTLAKYPEQAKALLDARTTVADALEQAGEDVAGLRSGIEDVRKALSFRDELEQAGEAWRSVKAFEASPSNKRISNVLQHGATLAGGALGGVAGALGGRVIGEVLSSAARPAAVLQTMGRLRQGIDKVAGREAGALRGLERLAEGGVSAARKVAGASRGIGQAASQGATRLGKGAASRVAQEDGRPARQVALEQARRSIVQLASKPEEIPSKMGPDLHEVKQVAPKLAQALIAQTSRALAFLAARAPNPYAPPFSGTSIVDPVALEKWGRYLDAVQDPDGAVERIEQGGLALEHAETLREVYPAKFRKLQADVLRMVGDRAKGEKPVSHRARVQLSLLLGMPLDQAMRPGFIERLSGASAIAQPAPAGEGQIRAAAGAQGPVAAQTTTERLEAGGMR